MYWKGLKRASLGLVSKKLIIIFLSPVNGTDREKYIYMRLEVSSLGGGTGNATPISIASLVINKYFFFKSADWREQKE